MTTPTIWRPTKAEAELMHDLHDQIVELLLDNDVFPEMAYLLLAWIYTEPESANAPPC